MTLGGPTISSKPSRRMFSMSTVRWSSPRPETWVRARVRVRVRARARARVRVRVRVS